MRIPLAGDHEEGDEPEEQIAAALAAVGLYAEAPLKLEEEFFLWPQCVEIFNLFRALGSQWRVGGMAEKTGLDYTAVQSYMTMLRIPKKRHPELLIGLQTMEFASLDEWAQKR